MHDVGVSCLSDTEHIYEMADFVSVCAGDSLCVLFPHVFTELFKAECRK